MVFSFKFCAEFFSSPERASQEKAPILVDFRMKVNGKAEVAEFHRERKWK